MAEPLDRPEPARQEAEPVPEDLRARMLCALEDRGVLELLTAALEQSHQILPIVVREMSRDSRTRAARNMFLLMGMLGRLPVEAVDQALRESPPARVGLVELWRRFRSPAVRRGLYRVSRMLEALGSEKSPGP